ncbi:hypothetical protein BX616_011080, partial [Lobosporangium transversale]
LPLQQYQNGGSHEKRGQFFPWPASATAMTPLPGNFGPLPLANTGTLTSTANPRITSRPFQTVAYTGLAAAAKHNTKRAADDMPASESLRPAQRRRLEASRGLSISSEATVVALPTVAMRAASQPTTESSPRSTQPSMPRSPTATHSSKVLSAMPPQGPRTTTGTESVRSTKCPHCDKEFQSKGLLRSHMSERKEETPH